MKFNNLKNIITVKLIIQIAKIKLIYLLHSEENKQCKFWHVRLKEQYSLEIEREGERDREIERGGKREIERGGEREQFVLFMFSSYCCTLVS